MKVNLNLAVISVLRRDKERYVRSLTEAVEDLFFFFFTHGAGRLQKTLDGWPPPVSSAG